MGGSAPPVLRDTVERYLRQSFGEVPVDQDDDFVVRRGDAVAWVRPVSLPPNDVAAVLVWTTSNVDVPMSPDLTRFLAIEGANLTFGQFQLYEDPVRVNIAHSLLGDFLSREELEVAVESVLSGAERYGPRIKERFGGRRLGEGAPRFSEERMVISEENTEELMDLLRRAEAASLVRADQEQQARGLVTRRLLQGLFGLIGLAAGVVAAIMIYGRTSSWAAVIFVFVLATYLIGRGIPDVITEPHRIRRALYFLVTPAVAAGVLFLSLRWWDRWWLAVLLALTVGAVLGAIISFVLFGRIAQEEMLDDAARRRAFLRGGS